MTQLWRIDKAARPKTESFSGVGARIAGGRWNFRGTPVVYASQSLALAALEKFVHTGTEGRELRLVSYRIEIPDGVMVERLSINDLSPDWSRYPSPESTMEIGTKWAKEMRSVVLEVPSVIVRSESNYLLNPLHKDFSALNVSAAEPFTFDPRMWGKK